MALPISGGSVAELSATDAWLGAVVGDGTYMASLLGMRGKSSHSPDKLRAAIGAPFGAKELNMTKAC